MRWTRMVTDVQARMEPSSDWYHSVAVTVVVVAAAEPGTAAEKHWHCELVRVGGSGTGTGSHHQSVDQTSSASQRTSDDSSPVVRSNTEAPHRALNIEVVVIVAVGSVGAMSHHMAQNWVAKHLKRESAETDHAPRHMQPHWLTKRTDGWRMGIHWKVS